MLGIAHVFQVAEHTICILYNEYVYKLWLFLGGIWTSSSLHRDVARAAMYLEVQVKCQCPFLFSSWTEFPE